MRETQTLAVSVGRVFMKIPIYRCHPCMHRLGEQRAALERRIPGRKFLMALFTYFAMPHHSTTIGYACRHDLRNEVWDSRSHLGHRREGLPRRRDHGLARKEFAR